MLGLLSFDGLSNATANKMAIYTLATLDRVSRLLWTGGLVRTPRIPMETIMRVQWYSLEAVAEKVHCSC